MPIALPIAFPLEVVPAARKLTPGAHPARVFKALNGAETPILLGDRMTGASVQASWPCLSDAEAQLAWTAWTDSYSGVYGTQVPPGLLLGLAADGLDFPAYLDWVIQAEPEINSIPGAPGYSTLSLIMRGRLLA
jgi:hypothetical protein